MTTYPIAEIFHSLQGEGHWVGTPMMFVRLAGCPVGEYHITNPENGFTENDPAELHTDDLPLFLGRKHSICTTLDGQRFLCDTNYHLDKKMTAEEIAMNLQGERRVCVTGGEPLVHDLLELATAMPLGVTLHIETSGTQPCPAQTPGFWITVCPKKGCLPDWYDLADEWKLLVGPGFDEGLMRTIEVNTAECIEKFLQPINGVESTNKDNELRCWELLQRHPTWRLSAQLHKYLEMR